MKKTRLLVLALLTSTFGLKAAAQCPQGTIEAAMAVPMSEWSFNQTRVTDPNSSLEWRYDLDTTHKLARWNSYYNYNRLEADKSITVPEAIEYNGEWYVVVAIDNPNGYGFSSDATSFTMPGTIRRIGEMAFDFDKISNYDIPASVEEIGKNAFRGASYDNYLTLTMHGTTVPVATGTLDGDYCSHYDSNNKNQVNYIRVMVPGDLFDQYIYANYWENCVIINADKYAADNAATDWTVIDRVDEGQLGYAIVADDLPNVRRYAEINCLKVLSGSLNEDDWYAIRQMKNLVKLELSGMTFTTVPNNATNYCWQLEDVVLPDCVESIGYYGFARTAIGKYSDYAPLATGEGPHDFHMPASLKTIGYNAFYDCDFLRNIYIPEGVKSIPSDCFAYSNNLNRVDLPAQLEQIVGGAFYNCNIIRHAIPGTVKTIGNSAYRYNYNLAELTLGEGIQTIDGYAFENCQSLDNLVTPRSLRTIKDRAFNGCKSLVNLNLQEGLETIQDYAFASCSNLEEITLPSSLLNLYSYPLYNNPKLMRIISKAIIPPTLKGYVPTNENNATLELLVPDWSIADYMTTPGWITYQKNTAVADIWPENLYIRKDFQLLFKNEQPQDYRPNLVLMQDDQTKDDGYGHNMTERGNLTIGSSTGLHLDRFEMVLSPWAKYDRDRDNESTYRDYENYTDKFRPNSLVVHGSIEAESATIHYQLNRDTWHAVYINNVDFADFVPDDPNTQFVIKRYDAVQRAAGNMADGWQDVTSGTLNGCYFVKCYNSDNKYYYEPIAFTATTNPKAAAFTLLKNGCGKPATVSAVSADDKDASWNLIAVERPCFYDSRYMTMTDGQGNSFYNFLVWNSYSRKYQAYSTRDDKYVISPAEAFFVQGPNSATAIDVTFDDRGRQYRANSRELDYYSSNARRIAAAEEGRLVYNIIATNDAIGDADRTRIVLNEQATTAFDAGSDMYEVKSTDNVLLVWTQQAGTELAINERPLGDGEVALGIAVAEAGYHSFRLAPADSECAPADQYDVYVEDIDEGRLTLISETDAYTFYTEQGEYPGRFYVHFVEKSNPTAIETLEQTVNARRAARYNLAGQQAGSNANGVVIENGKKVIR